MPTPKHLLPLLACLLASCTHVQTPASVNADHESAAIRRHRMGELLVQAAPGTTVTVEQLRHEFWFGAAISNGAFNGRMSPADAARYQQVFLENFNAAVTENALKWLDMERERGKPNYAVVDAMLAWTDRHGLPLRGHNLYWGIEQFVQPWLKTMDDATLRATLEARGRDIARRYKGRFAEYDLNNEMIHGNYYADRLGKTITRDMAQWVKEEDPAAVLFLNDYDITTGRMLEPYVAHIKELLALGVPIGGIGVQGHLHGDSFDPVALRHSLDVLAQFKLPIRITEFNFPGQRSRFYEHRELPITEEEEQNKAKAIADFYRICFAHPAVEGILMWGFWEGANWIPQSSLYRRDWTPTPAAHAYRQLVYGEWWTRWKGTTDARGRCVVPVFLGTHRVTAGDRSATVQVTRASSRATANLR